MKTKLKTQTIVQQMYKVIVSDKMGTNKTFICTANSIEEAQKLAKEMYPNYKIGYAFECVDNWVLCL